MTLPIRNSRVRTSRGVFFCREVGHGPTMLCLHGTWTDSSQWVPLMTVLGQRFHCIAPDLLGCGESSRLPPQQYAIDMEVAGLQDCLKSLRLAPHIIIADSLGAWVAIRYCLQYPDAVQQLIVVAPEGITHPTLDRRWEQYRWLARSWALRYWLVQALSPLIRICGGDRWLKRVRQTRRQLRDHAAVCRLLFQRRKTALRAEWLNDALPHLTVPMMIVSPDEATPATQLVTQCLQDLLPSAQVQQVPGNEADIWETGLEALWPWFTQVQKVVRP
jgi:pimeloyl-ACP methyl ester carboxylesterase